MQVGAISSVFEGGGDVNSRSSWGWESMSTVHPQTTPSVEQLMILFAFCVPTTEIE